MRDTPAQVAVAGPGLSVETAERIVDEDVDIKDVELSSEYQAAIGLHAILEQHLSYMEDIFPKHPNIRPFYAGFFWVSLTESLQWEMEDPIKCDDSGQKSSAYHVITYVKRL